MYYFKKVIELALLLAIIWLSIENYTVKVSGLMVFGYEIKDTSVVFVVFTALISGALISAFFSALKEWKIVRDNKKTVKDLKTNIKELEARLNLESSELKKEILSLKEIVKNGK
ncbi:TPA: hypothetical protein DCR49_08300 [Candidatus Delongbacteria bacterium]|nr:hypothetical protein [Candidatus Delongbacteria bacterium]